MAVGKWIGGVLGFITGGPLGALAGFALGWIFDRQIDSDLLLGEDADYSHQSGGGGHQQQSYQEGQRNSFLFSFLALASYIIRIDGKVMHSEMEAIRQFLRNNFGEVAVRQGERTLLRLFDYQKQVGMAEFESTIRSACGQISQNMNYPERLQLLDFLVMLAQADGHIDSSEINAIRFVGQHMGIYQRDVESLLHLDKGTNQLDDAYKVLGIDASATDEEVKSAYKKMALKHHPDRVSGLGEDIRQAAENKLKEINAAKELIYKQRGIS